VPASRVSGIELENRLDLSLEFHGRVHFGPTALDVGSAREYNGQREPPSHIVRVAFASRTSMALGPFEELFPSILLICCLRRLDEHPYRVGHAVDHPCGALIWTDWDRFLSRERSTGGNQHEDRTECGPIQSPYRSAQSHTRSWYGFEKRLSGSHFGLPSPLRLECTGKNALNRVTAGYVKLRSTEAEIT